MRPEEAEAGGAAQSALAQGGSGRGAPGEAIAAAPDFVALSSDSDALEEEESEAEAEAEAATRSAADRGTVACDEEDASSEDGSEDGSDEGSDENEQADGVAPQAAKQVNNVSSDVRAATEVFVGGLSFDATEEDLQATFSVAGDIAEIRVMRDRETGTGKGFAFVRYQEASAATTALEHLNGMEVCGRPVGVVRSQAHTQLFLGGFPKDWLEGELSAALTAAKVRGVEEVRVPPDPGAPGRSRGFATVRFDSHSSALSSLKRLGQPGFKLPGNRGHCKVSWAREEPSQAEVDAVTTLLVTRLPEGDAWGEQELRALCEPHGAVLGVVHARALNPPPKRADFAYVRFGERAHAEQALLALHGARIEAQEGAPATTLEAAFAKPRPEKKKKADGAPGRGGRGRGDHSARGRAGGRAAGRGGDREAGGRGAAAGGASMSRLMDAMRSQAHPAPPSEPAAHVLPSSPQAGRHGGRGDGGRGRGKRDFTAMAGGGRDAGRGGGRARSAGGRGGGMPAQQPQHAAYYPANQQQQQQQHYAMMMMHQQAQAQAAASAHYAAMAGMHPQAHAYMMQQATAAAMAHLQGQQRPVHEYGFGNAGAAGGYAAGYYQQQPQGYGAPMPQVQQFPAAGAPHP